MRNQLTCGIEVSEDFINQNFINSTQNKHMWNARMYSDIAAFHDIATTTESLGCHKETPASCSIFESNDYLNSA